MNAVRRGQRLTWRELQVLERVAEGETRARIARALGISESTVKKHLEHLNVKLGSNGSRSNLVHVAHLKGVLTQIDLSQFDRGRVRRPESVRDWLIQKEDVPG